MICGNSNCQMTTGGTCAQCGIGHPAWAPQPNTPPPFELPHTYYVLGCEGDGYSQDRLLIDAAYSEEQMRTAVAERDAWWQQQTEALRADAERQNKIMHLSAPGTPMLQMIAEDGRIGWYIDHEDFYCDIEPDKETNALAVFCRLKDGREGYWEQQKAAPPAAQPQGEREAMTQNEYILRLMLCLVYTGAGAYLDDGELQDNKRLPFIDFRLDSPADIQRKIIQRNLSDAYTDDQMRAASAERDARWQQHARRFDLYSELADALGCDVMDSHEGRLGIARKARAALNAARTKEQTP